SLGDTGNLFIDHQTNTLSLGMNFDDCRMTRSERRGLLGLTSHDLGILGTQCGHGLRLNRFAECSDIGPRPLEIPYLIESRFRFRRTAPRQRQLIVQLAKLLLVDQLTAGSNDIVASLELLGPLLGLAHPLLEFMEARCKRLRGPASGL